MPPPLAASSNSWNLVAFDIQRSRVDPTTGLDLNDDTSTNAPKILAINGALAGFTLVVVLLRFFVRTVMLKSMGIDDWLIGIAMLCGIGTFACFTGETKHGIGMNSDAIPFTENIKMLQWQFFHAIIVTIGISFVKISVACFLLRLVPSKKYKFFLYGAIG
ncbi:hypothetical protein BJ875DRAFT_384579 [Amylocarpus encephaloides]|uniref:Rhodopsin domain-containing protein n=1 Tax=Amylocarpus encephaloides TaxID=45428 RepID=A0A9P8C293_9HELO|nr:hypothetical protein BJ875DRAFT_384579 [Amylocarpus encephaloides]